MIEAAVIVLRLLQYAGAAVLFGSSLYFLYALPASGPNSAAAGGWARPLAVAAAIVLALSALLAIGVQGSVFTGSFAEGFGREALSAVVGSMALGKAALVRAVAAGVAAVCLIVLRPGAASWLAASVLGAIAAASLGWMGHAAADEGAFGTWHLAADILHALTASAWVGALVAFAFQVRGNPGRAVLHTALRRFSAIGVPLVAVLVATGLVNSWFLVGPDRLASLAATPYGKLLTAKLALFAAMLVLAATNRNRLTPALEAHAGSAGVASLRRSLRLELALGLAVLALVAWFGTLQPPA